MTLRVITSVLFAVAAGAAGRLACADLLARHYTTGTPATTAPDALRRAVNIAPNVAYLDRLADLDPDHAREASQQAVALNPRSSEAWIALGLAAERSRDFTEAARDLEQAARVDRQYLPAWTLANYYFRRGNQSSFWIWAKRAAALGFGDSRAEALGADDPRPLVTLADRIGLIDPPSGGLIDPPSGGLIDPPSGGLADPPSRLGGRLPPGRVMARLGGSDKLLRAYLDLLIDEDRLDDAQAIARMILARAKLAWAALDGVTSDGRRDGRGSAQDTLRLRAFTTRLIAADRGPEAFEIWNGIGSLAGPGAPHPAEPPALFDPMTSGEGFDWRLPANSGVSSISRNSVLAFTLDGRQPETCPLLERAVAIPSASNGKLWRVRLDYSTALAGLRWAFDTRSKAVPPQVSAPLERSPGWRDAEWTFTPLPRPAAPVTLGRLVLFYRRDAGHVPAEGGVQIRSLRVEVE